MSTAQVFDGLVHIQLPDGWSLTALDGQPPEQFYCSYDLPDQQGVFALLLQPAPGQSPIELLRFEQSMQATVTIIHQTTEELRYRSHRLVPSHTDQNPSIGRTEHREQISEELITARFWIGSTRTLRASYRVVLDAPAKLIALLDTTIASVELQGEL